MSIAQFPVQAWEVLAEAAKAHAVLQDRAEAFTCDNTEPLDKELTFGPTFNIENVFEDPLLIHLSNQIKRLKLTDDRATSFQIMIGRNTYVTVKITGPIEVRKAEHGLIEVIAKEKA